VGRPDEPERVGAMFSHFSCLYRSGRYHESLAVLQKACQSLSSPRCLFDLGVVHHALLHCELAQSYYRQYLDGDPYDMGRQRAESALNELGGVCGTSESEALLVQPPEPRRDASIIAPLEAGAPSLEPPRFALEPTAVPQAPSAARRLEADTALQTTGAILLGSGAACLAGSLAFALSGERARQDIEDLARRGGDADSPEARAIDRNGKRYNVLGWVFGIGGGLLLGTGATLRLWPRPEAEGFALSLDEGARLGYRRAF
jgi:hypothetical protein